MNITIGNILLSQVKNPCFEHTITLVDSEEEWFLARKVIWYQVTDQTFYNFNL